MMSRRESDRSRSPGRSNRRPEGKKASFHSDRPKFDDSPSKEENKRVVSQLSTDALWKEAKPYRQRSDRFQGPRRFPDFKPRRYGDQPDRRFERQTRDSARNDGGDRRDENRRGHPKYNEDPSKLKDIISAPRSGYYFEHDDRADTSFDRSPPRRNERFRNGVERRHDTFGLKRSDSNPNGKSLDARDRRDSSDGFWKHDKFEDKEDGGDVHHSQTTGH